MRTAKTKSKARNTSLTKNECRKKGLHDKKLNKESELKINNKRQKKKQNNADTKQEARPKKKKRKTRRKKSEDTETKTSTEVRHQENS